jgi:6-phosphogluconolactonase
MENMVRLDLLELHKHFGILRQEPVAGILVRSLFCGLIALLVFTAASLQAEFVYVGSPTSISVYSVREDGTLVAVGSPYPVAGGARSVTIDPVGRAVYMLSGKAPAFITAFSISEKGCLTPVPGSPFPTENAPSDLAIDTLGRFIYVPTSGASYPGGPAHIDGFVIGANGALTPTPGSTFDDTYGTYDWAVAVDPVSRTVYVTNLLAGGVTVYDIEGNGNLQQRQQSPAGIFAYSLKVSVLRRFVYVSASAHPRGLYCSSIGADGSLTGIPGAPFLNGPSPTSDTSATSIAIDPWEQFVFVANTSNITVYRIGANGALTPVVGSPFPGGGSCAAVDPSGRFLYVAESNSVEAYRISENGALAPAANSPFPKGVSSIAVNP